MVNPPAITDYLESALRAASFRQSVIANNIANINTDNYRRNAVNFEARLAQAIASGESVDIDQLTEDIFQPKNTPISPNGNDVSLEMEVGDLVKNTAMYKTYMRLLGRVYRKMDLAINDK